MKYQFSFYQSSDFDELVSMVKKSYQWEYPFVDLSRVIFSKGLLPKFRGYPKAWEHTVGMFWENKKLAACVWNEGVYDGEVFFLFDSKERAYEIELLKEMINFAKMYGVTVEEPRVRSFKLWVPEWNEPLKKLVNEMGLKKGDWSDHCNILKFQENTYEVKLPKGYTITDGNHTPSFYLSNVHRMAFGYGKEIPGCEHGAEAFEELRTMKYYDKDLDLCILDEYGRPVAIAIIWYDTELEYCELEPLGVVWWKRRKGLGTAIIHEAANRVMKKYPMCKGLRGGDQPFYKSIGFETMAQISHYSWKKKVYLSWESESRNEDYAKEMEW